MATRKKLLFCSTNTDTNFRDTHMSQKRTSTQIRAWWQRVRNLILFHQHNQAHTYIKHIHQAHTSSTYIKHIHQAHTYIKHIHQAHTSSTYIKHELSQKRVRAWWQRVRNLYFVPRTQTHISQTHTCLKREHQLKFVLDGKRREILSFLSQIDTQINIQSRPEFEPIRPRYQVWKVFASQTQIHRSSQKSSIWTN